MNNKIGLLSFSAMLLLSSGSATGYVSPGSEGKAIEEGKISKNSLKTQEKIISDSFFPDAEIVGEDNFLESLGAENADFKASQHDGFSDQVAVTNVESVEESDFDFSTQALDLRAPTVGQSSSSNRIEYAELLAQESPDEAEEMSDGGFTFPGDISATVTITTNYVFRGISQTDNNPAIQGSFDYSVGLVEDLDFYAGIWGSNIDFGDEADFGGESLGTLELDFYGGVTYALSDNASVGGSIVYYFYPGADDSLDFDYIEFGLDASYDFGPVATAINFAYSPDFFGGSEDGFYIAGSAEAPLPYGLTASAGLGFQAISDNDTFGTPDYLEWNIGVGYAIAGFDLLLQYIDTDLSNSECFGGTDLCDARVVFSASRTF